jgi:hypothetical protein
MSFIPGEQSQIAAVSSTIGSGIEVTTQNDIDFVAVKLVAGANISIVPSTVDNTVEISSAGSGGGISSVTSGANSGINATTVGGAVSLTSALVGGNGVNLTSGSGKNLIINNSHTYSSANGSGISITATNPSPSQNNFALATNLGAGSGIALTPSGTNTSIAVSNTGVLSATAGSGIQISNPTGAITISSTGVASATAGTGISLTGSAQNPTINNTGLLSASAGSGIGVSTTNGVATISNTGLTQLTSSNAGTGISISGTATNPTISNTGITALTAGTNITLTGSPTAPTINAAPTTYSAGTGININGNVISNTGVNAITSPNPGILIGGSSTNPTITNTGVIQVNTPPNSGISITGNNPSLPVFTNTGVLSLTAGPGISLSSTTGNITISSTLSGVQVQLSGTAQNPIVSAIQTVAPIILAGNNNGAITTSTDGGITWAACVTPPWATNFSFMYDAIWDGTKFYACIFNNGGSATAIYTSTNGLTGWTPSSYTGINLGQGIAYGNGIYVLGGQDGVSGQGDRIAYSTNGTSWTGLNDNQVTGGANLVPYSVVFWNNAFWITGTNTQNTAIWRSVNGQTWTNVSFGGTNAVSNPSLFVANNFLYWQNGANPSIIYQYQNGNWVAMPQNPPVTISSAVTFPNNSKTYYTTNVGVQSFTLSVQNSSIAQGSPIAGLLNYGYITAGAWVGDKVVIAGSGFWTDDGAGLVQQTTPSGWSAGTNGGFVVCPAL